VKPGLASYQDWLDLHHGLPGFIRGRLARSGHLHRDGVALFLYRLGAGILVVEPIALQAAFAFDGFMNRNSAIVRSTGAANRALAAE
jgi:hypothetical protein